MSHMDRIQVEPRFAATSMPECAALPKAESQAEPYEDEFGLFIPPQPTRADLLAAAAALSGVAGALIGIVAFLS